MSAALCAARGTRPPAPAPAPSSTAQAPRTLGRFRLSLRPATPASRRVAAAAAAEGAEDLLAEEELQLAADTEAPLARVGSRPPSRRNLDFSDPSWADVVDGVHLTWEDFWNHSEEIIFAEPDAEEIEARGEDAVWLTPEERLQAVLDQLPELRKRPGFKENVCLGGGKTEHDIGEPEDAIDDPDWDEWDLRALREKRKLAEIRAEAFAERIAALGVHEPLNMQDQDMRVMANLRVPEDELREWSHDEIWRFITNDGRHADPRLVAPETFLVEDPLAPIDYNLRGVDYVEETEEFLDRIGHWLPGDAMRGQPEAELTLMDKDFELDAGLMGVVDAPQGPAPLAE